jgi:HAD superfamily hydrolase (TIGR01484 family)
MSESKVPSGTAAVLQKISQRIPVAIITTKDLSFVVKRTPFACAWAGLGGLEIKIGDVTFKSQKLRKAMKHLTIALKRAKRLSNNDITIEEKRDSEEVTVAFSVDWRKAKNISATEDKAMKILAYCETLPVSTIKYEGQPFFDVFPVPLNKGKALLELKQKLGLSDGIMYLGDSTVDNPAFEEADIAVGVLHEETPNDLVCDYFVKFEDVTAFLRGLLKDNFRLSLSSPLILHRA